MDKTCSHCNHTGNDVGEYFYRITDGQYQMITECYDREACWERWHERHELRPDMMDLLRMEEENE